MAGEEAEDDHPIVARAVELLETTLDGAYELSPAAQSILEAEIDQHLGSKELPRVVDGLLRLAHVLEVEASSDLAAAAVCAALERDPVVKALRRGRVSNVDPAESGRAFQTFTQTAPRRLPSDEPAQETLLKPHEWKGPRRV